jgi:hypothetical protein
VAAVHRAANPVTARRVYRGRGDPAGRAAGTRPGSAVTTWEIGPHREDVELDVDGYGGRPYGRYPFGVSLEEERSFAGVTIPTVVRAGWWWGTPRAAEGEFFRARIVEARFR